jgi:glycosidase
MAYFRVPPGEYGYLVVEDGATRLDELNPLTAFHAGSEVSWLRSEDCSVPKVRVDEVEATDEGRVRVHATFLASGAGDPLDVRSVRGTGFEGTTFRVERADPTTGKVVLAGDGLGQGKYTVVVEAADRAGRVAEEARAVAWVRPAMREWTDGILYQIMTDRFLGSGAERLGPPPTPGSRAGGTFDGVRAAIESGELEELGVTGVWLSPVYLNPTEAREGPWDGRMYEGYHGYWVQESRRVDPRLGGEEALHALVAAAHSRGLRVLLDIVPNHVYETNPIYREKQGKGWFFDGADKCICGNAPCPWSTHIETCWFTSYLPDYRWQHIEVMQHGEAESLWWTHTFDIDGVRVDAVPMMPRAATRRIAHGLRSSVHPSSEQFLLGEIYTGGGQGGIDQIRYHLGPAGLNSAFDFPLMWALRNTIAHGKGSFEDIADILEASERSYAGSGVTMSLIVGNHDTTRFLSEAHGDAAQDPWEDPPVQPTGPEPYARHRMAMALVMTLPGLPVIYYGDELGLAGGGDPDCRRVMPASSDLNAHQQGLLQDVRRLGKLRRCSEALRRGEQVTLRADEDTYAFVRDGGDGRPVLVAMSKASLPRELEVGAGVLPTGEYVDVLTGDRVVMGEGGGRIVVESLTVRVLVLESDPCR